MTDQVENRRHRSGFRGALGFLSIAGGAAAPTPRSLPWFGVVGAGIGTVVGASHWVALQLTTPLLAAVVTVGVDLAVTGLLHLDGLADSADGVLPPLDRARRLAVMKDPAVGAFGVAVVVLVLAARIAAFAAIGPSTNGLTNTAQGLLNTILPVAAIWAVSRVVMAAVARHVPYARATSGGGLASAFTNPQANGTLTTPGSTDLFLALSVAGATALAAGGAGIRGAVAIVGCITGALAFVTFARHRLGGFTGDVLGAAGIIGETAALMLLAVR